MKGFFSKRSETNGALLKNNMKKFVFEIKSKKVSKKVKKGVDNLKGL